MENTLINPNEKLVKSDEKKPIKKMMLILSKATKDNVYACFILANVARMEGIETEIFFTFF
jgi:predicted peroxiredoxin